MYHLFNSQRGPFTTFNSIKKLLFSYVLFLPCFSPFFYILSDGCPLHSRVPLSICTLDVFLLHLVPNIIPARSSFLPRDSRKKNARDGWNLSAKVTCVIKWFRKISSSRCFREVDVVAPLCKEEGKQRDERAVEYGNREYRDAETELRFGKFKFRSR